LGPAVDEKTHTATKTQNVLSSLASGALFFCVWWSATAAARRLARGKSSKWRSSANAKHRRN
jgi:hypothetical protein